MKQRIGFAGGLVLVMFGTVWMLQGMNARLAPVSFMTNNRLWIVYGAVTVVTGLWLAARSRGRL